MIRITETEVFGWDAAIRGMRNPKNSWSKSDTYWQSSDEPTLGQNDLKLMKTLIGAGTDHRKFLRMINVTMDVLAPLYWWKEYDTYKVGTVANSCSTMHKIHDKEFTIDDFSFEDCDKWTKDVVCSCIINALEMNRKKFLETKDKGVWRQMIQLLPSSYNQKRTCQVNYEVLAHMYHSRKNHKLSEWREFCAWVESLPYSYLITMKEVEQDAE